MSRCETCFRHCEIAEGGLGFCGGRTCEGGAVRAANYGLVTSAALDPIEKKPLYHFYPGSRILSVGSYGCNLRCPFCQNEEISWSQRAFQYADSATYLSPERLTELAASEKKRGNIGVAFTYNEPLIGWEYVLDTAKLVRAAGMKNAIVTNGMVSLSVLEKLAPYVDAMNIDLKGFTDRFYGELLKGDRGMVLDFIAEAVKVCHVELTTLIIPGENDSDDEMRELSGWIADLDGRGEIPYHVSRFFPHFHMMDRAATDVATVYHLAEVAREKLKYVYTGNC